MSTSAPRRGGRVSGWRERSQVQRRADLPERASAPVVVAKAFEPLCLGPDGGGVPEPAPAGLLAAAAAAAAAGFRLGFWVSTRRLAGFWWVQPGWLCVWGSWPRRRLAAAAAEAAVGPGGCWPWCPAGLGPGRKLEWLKGGGLGPRSLAGLRGQGPPLLGRSRSRRSTVLGLSGGAHGGGTGDVAGRSPAGRSGTCKQIERDSHGRAEASLTFRGGRARQWLSRGLLSLCAPALMEAGRRSRRLLGSLPRRLPLLLAFVWPLGLDVEVGRGVVGATRPAVRLGLWAKAEAGGGGGGCGGARRVLALAACWPRAGAQSSNG